LPCHRCKHVELLQAIGCSFKTWHETIISTIDFSVASSKVIKPCFVHNQGCLSENWSANIPELISLWYSILQTVGNNALVHHAGFQLRAAINWSHSSQCIPVVWYTVQWRPLTTVWIHWHPSAKYFLFVLLQILRTIIQFTSWVIHLVAVLAALQWSNWCLRSRCVPIRDVFDKPSANWLEVDLVLAKGPDYRVGSGSGSIPEPNRCNGFSYNTRCSKVNISCFN
jgi:hypothetical protein